MTTIALREYIINKINTIEDIKELESIKNYIEPQKWDNKELSPDLIVMLEKSQKQVNEGDYITHEEMMAKVDVWIRERE